jgi:hypothetical protein
MSLQPYETCTKRHKITWVAIISSEITETEVCLLNISIKTLNWPSEIIVTNEVPSRLSAIALLNGETKQAEIVHDDSQKMVVSNIRVFWDFTVLVKQWPKFHNTLHVLYPFVTTTQWQTYKHRYVIKKCNFATFPRQMTQVQTAKLLTSEATSLYFKEA